MKLTTTLNEIWEQNPCGKHTDSTGWGLLLKNLGKTAGDDEPLDVMEILESNGIEDATWALRCFDYREYCLFLADVAESVLHIFESKYPGDKQPRRAIQAVRDYHANSITKKELQFRAAAAARAAYAAARAAAAAYAAYAAAYAAADAADAACAAYYAADAADGWDEIKKLFIKHFGSK